MTSNRKVELFTGKDAADQNMIKGTLESQPEPLGKKLRNTLRLYNYMTANPGQATVH